MEKARRPTGSSDSIPARAKKLDDAYFEKLTSLDWRKTIKRNGKQHISQIENLPELNNLDEIPEGSGDDQEVVLDTGKAKCLSDQQRETLYCEAVYTIMYKIGVEDKKLSNGDLYVYLQEALKISEEKHRELYDKMKTRQAPKNFLKVQVTEARNLQAKDANGFSDPYCMVGLIKTQQSEPIQTKVKRKISKTLQEIIKSESIQMTTVRENTLNPTWNETFIFEVNDINTDILHIDIWDCDDKEMLSDKDNKITKIKGFHGVGRYFKDAVQSARASSNDSTDDFLGYFEFPLKDIPCDGIDDWFTLKTKSSKCRVSGDCHVKISLSSAKRTDYESGDHAFYSFFPDLFAALLLEFVQYDVQNKKMTECSLSIPAEYILHQLALQNDLSSLQEAAIRWRFYSEFHWTNPLQYDTLCILAHKVAKEWSPQRLSDREDRALRQSLQRFVENCLKLLLKHRDLYPPTNKCRFGRLVNLVECLLAVSKMDVYRSSDGLFQAQSITKIVKESATVWYDKTHAWHEPREPTLEEKLAFVINLAESVLTDILTGIKFYQKVFRLIGVDYVTATYCQLELMLANDVRLFLESVKLKIKHHEEKDIVGENLFALYLIVRELMSYRKHVDTREDHVFGLDDLHLWFKIVVLRWFDIAQSKAKQRIERAISLDKFLCIDASVKHSSSAVDATSCFYQIREFWRKLDWPDAVGSYMYVTQIIQMICTTGLYYADLVFEKMLKEDYYDNDPTQFDVSEQLCVTLNDIEHIRVWLSTLPTMMDMDNVVASLTKIHGKKGGDHVLSSIGTLVNSADEDMLNKIITINEHIGQKMSVDLKKFIIHLSWEQNPKAAEEAISPLLQYLDDNLMVLNQTLVKSVFNLILSYMWEIVVESFSNMVKTGRGNPPEFYIRLEEAIEIVKVFFHAEGSGLPYEQLTDGQLYATLQESLKQRSMTSQRLIEVFYVNLCQRQKEVPEKYGVITLRAFYDMPNSKVHVEVLNARNLLALDSNGLSDPYVILRLQPSHLFGRAEQKSKVMKNTLFPLFDEKFSFSVSAELCRTEGACLTLTVMDYDVISNDDMEGFAVLSLNSLVGLNEPVEGGFANIPQIMLNLMQPTLEGVQLQTLECRKDKEAENFVKEQKLSCERFLVARSK